MLDKPESQTLQMAYQVITCLEFPNPEGVGKDQGKTRAYNCHGKETCPDDDCEPGGDIFEENVVSDTWDFHLLQGEIPELDESYIAMCNAENRLLS